MKVLLLGNTCNNNFAFLRHLVDLNIDAHLCLYADEGYLASNPIHNPSWDTPAASDQYASKIHRLDLPNSPKAILFAFILQFFCSAKVSKFKKLISSADIVVGSGISPSLLLVLGLRLDVFYPYSTGIEWLEEVEHLKKMRRFNVSSIFYRFIHTLQLKGIRKARKVIINDLGSSKRVLDRYSIKFFAMLIPQYYKDVALLGMANLLSDPIELIVRSSSSNCFTPFRIFSFMRHLWVYDQCKHDATTWYTHNKRNDILISGFARFINENDISDSFLYLSEFGPDVESSRNLVSSLGIASYVVWLPLMPRYQLSLLLADFADLGVGEFGLDEGGIWGSTGWECIAHGIPFLQTLNFSRGVFESEFGLPLPVIFNCKDSDHICSSICNAYFNKVSTLSDFSSNSSWHEDYAGHSLALKWIDLFFDIVRAKANAESD